MCVCVFVHVILTFFTIYYRFLFIILLHTIEFNHAMNKIEVTTYILIGKRRQTKKKLEK